MVILVEGPDNAGKSTLVSELIRHRPRARVSKTVGTPPALEEMLEALRELGMSLDSDEDVVFDRNPVVSEAIYGRTLGRGSRLGRDIVEATLWRMSSYRQPPRKPLSTLIYCRPPEDVVLTFDEREQMGGVRENARELLRAYDDWYAVETCGPMWRKAFAERRIHDWTLDPQGRVLIGDLQRMGLW